MKIYLKENNSMKEDFYSSNILKMSGCGTCLVKDNFFAYGDLSGNISTIAWAAKSGREVAKQIDLT